MSTYITYLSSPLASSSTSRTLPHTVLALSSPPDTLQEALITVKLLNLLSFTVLSLGATVSAQNATCSTLADRHIINIAQAEQAIAAAQAQAASIGVSASIAVTDASGFLLAFRRSDNARLLSVDVSQRKARTVSLFAGAFTTAALYNLTQPGAPLFGITETIGGLVALGGGVPIFRDGVFIGAIGVSGGTSDQDAIISMAGAQAVRSARA